MNFTKMHGCGNDYVMVNCFTEEIHDIPRAAIKLSNRFTGVGSDGLILIKPSEIADFQMEIYNSDGSSAQMCGNGIRCLGKYVYDYGLTTKKHISVETKAGIKYLDLMLENNEVSKVRVDMGSPILRPMEIPVITEEESNINLKVTVEGEIYQATCVSMGNPHAVLFVDNIRDWKLNTLGKKIENHPMFPERINVEIIHVLNPSEIEMRVWERGAGETLACGTGACASVVASILHGYTKNRVTVHLLGGDLEIEYQEENNLIYMTGPAVKVFDGIIHEK